MNVTLGVGMLGYAFMGKAHSRAFHNVLLLSPPYKLVYRALGGE
jgi:hypothetical protein